MADEVQWELDPSVRIMRRVFERIEAAQNELLQSLGISPFDTRLRPWRETALTLFEKSWVQAKKHGIDVEEEQVPALYIQCLIRTIDKEGVQVPRNEFTHDEKIMMLLKETLP